MQPLPFVPSGLLRIGICRYVLIMLDSLLDGLALLKRVGLNLLCHPPEDLFQLVDVEVAKLEVRMRDKKLAEESLLPCRLLHSSYSIVALSVNRDEGIDVTTLVGCQAIGKD